MSDMHSSLDQFNAMLSSFEAEMEVSGSSTPRPPPPSEFADEDTLLKHDLRKGVENYNSMVRDVIESTLGGDCNNVMRCE